MPNSWQGVKTQVHRDSERMLAKRYVGREKSTSTPGTSFEAFKHPGQGEGST